MVAPLILFMLSCTAFAGAVWAFGPVLTLWSGVAVLMVLASALLCVAALTRLPPRSKLPPLDLDPLRPAPRKPDIPQNTRPAVLVDGSNVMFWEDETPRLETVQRVVQRLREGGLRVGVVFDANAGYRMFDRYIDDAEFARHLGLHEDQVLVVPKGTVADEYLLTAARDMKARIVTNDKYRDWADRFPEVRTKGRLIKGSVLNGKARFENLSLAARSTD